MEEVDKRVRHRRLGPHQLRPGPELGGAYRALVILIRTQCEEVAAAIIEGTQFNGRAVLASVSSLDYEVTIIICTFLPKLFRIRPVIEAPCSLFSQSIEQHSKSKWGGHCILFRKMLPFFSEGD